MGLFDLFKSKPKFIDPVFGELTYITFKDSLKNYYEGEVLFNSQKIGVGIDADESGPTDAQRNFFTKIEAHFSSIEKTILIPYLEKELEGWEESYRITDFEKEFEVDGISLTRISTEWSICLFSLKIKHYVTIEFVDLKPQPNPVIDG